MENQFISAHSGKDIISSVSLIILGSVLIAAPVGVSLNIIGAIVFISGIITIFILKSSFKNTEDGKKYSKKELYFANNKREALIAAIKSAPETINIDKNEIGNAIRLDLYYSKDAGKAYLQLFEYVPYQYEPCSEQKVYSIDKVAELIK